MRGSRSTLRAAALAALMGGCGAGGGGGGEGTAPVVSFVEPRGGASFAEGEPVALRAVAEDADDGPGGLAFAFVSDRDGTLGAGFTDAAGVAALPGVALGPGSHRLIARIADPSGQVGEADVGVDVVEDAPPGVAWDPPGEGPFPAQDALVLTGSAWDGEDAPGTLRLEVASSGGEALPEVAPDEAGRFQVRAEGLLPGPHVFAVTVIDGVGQAAQATVDVEVIDCPDADGDGVGACAGDCDDGDPAVRPGAPEECDGVDGDCDGAVPPEEEDGDGDGHRGCVDCADGAAWIHPGAAEACDLLDGDCDGELPPEETDADGDGFVPCLGDCDDADPAARPGAEDPPGDGLDQDCDGGDSGWAVGPSVRIAGGVEGARFGAAVAVVDGGGEGAWLVVGEPEYGGGAGRVRAFAAGALEEAEVDAGGAAAWEAVGGPGERLGARLAAVGDVDGDGWADVVAAAPGDGAGGDGLGSLVLLPGAALAAGEGSAHRLVAGLAPGGALGADLLFAAELDGDGRADLLVGARSGWREGEEGEAEALVLAGAVLAAAAEGGGVLGAAAASARLRLEGGDVLGATPVGDLDGDGLDEVRNAYGIYSGADFGAGDGEAVVVDAGAPWARISTPGGTWWWAGSASGLPDLDGDGLGELALGEAGGGAAGAVWVVPGAALAGGGTRAAGDVALLRLDGGAAGDLLGAAVLPLGDADGDGLGEVVIGAPGAAEGGAGAGAIYLVPGARLAAAASGPVWASAVRVDGDAGGGLGAAMTLAAGDLDGDGRGDAALGCPGCGTGGAPPGEVWIVWGRDWP